MNTHSYNLVSHIYLLNKEGSPLKAFDEFCFVLLYPPYYPFYLQEGRSSCLTNIHTNKRISCFSCRQIFDSIVGRKSMMDGFVTSKTFNSILCTGKDEVDEVTQNRMDLVLLSDLSFTLKERSTELSSEPSRSFRHITKIRHPLVLFRFKFPLNVYLTHIQRISPQKVCIETCFSNFIMSRKTIRTITLEIAFMKIKCLIDKSILWFQQQGNQKLGGIACL